MDLQRATVLVTGAGRGLGAELLLAFGRAGARVVGVARTAAELDAAVAAARAEGIDAHGIVADIADKEAVHRVVGAAAGMAGPIDVLVNNASTLGPVPLRPLSDTACEDLAAVLETNLVGPFRLTKAVVGHMRLAGRGLVVNVSSDASVNGYAEWGAYSVSKAALDHLGRVWAAETEGTGVRFLTVDPGEMDTRMHADAIPDADRATLARPADVAAALVRLVRHPDAPPSGARVVLGVA